jgi:serine/threonine-protein kinase
MEKQKLGRYEIVAELGHGAMGTVYQARDPRIDRTVAIKTVQMRGASAVDEKEFLERFFREAQAAGKLAHPGIVTVYDVGEDEASKTPYIVMEYIAGATLEAMTSNGIKPAAALDLTKQIAEALHYAHAQGIVHRDIKPANIIVTGEGRAKITDFGVAKLAVSEFTQTGQVLGTPSYMSPEQLSGGKIDGRSDLFSLGVTLYILLTGAKPFSGETISEITFKVAYQQPKPATQLNAALNPDCDYVLERALAKNAEDRYRNGQELAADLDDLRAGKRPRSQRVARKPGERGVAEKTRTIHATGAAAAPAPAVAVAPTTVVQPPAFGWRTAVPWLRYRLASLPLRLQLALALVLVLVAGGFAFFINGPQPAEVELSSTATSEPEVFGAGVPENFGAAAPENFGSHTATLRVRGTHPFHRGQLTVFLDDRKLQSITLRGGGVHKQYWGLRKTPLAGGFDFSLPVAAGSHKLRIEVASGTFFQSGQIQGSFAARAHRLLRVTLQSGEIGLQWLE